MVYLGKTYLQSMNIFHTIKGSKSSINELIADNTHLLVWYLPSMEHLNPVKIHVKRQYTVVISDINPDFFSPVKSRALTQPLVALRWYTIADEMHKFALHSSTMESFNGTQPVVRFISADGFIKVQNIHYWAEV